MTAQRLVTTLTTLAGGAVGLFAPIGFVQWLLRTNPEVAGILTLFFFPVWCPLVVLGLLIGRRAGRLVTGGPAGRAEMKLKIRSPAARSPRWRPVSRGR
jgi:hypothetical protein